MDQRNRLLEKAKELPFSPGVYLMNDPAGEVIYVGKAKQLRNRVTSYFQPALHESPRTEMMVGRVFKFEVIITGTEDEALILENSLIKRYKPKFNVRLKDDKTYPYLKIRSDIPYPKIEWTRKVRKDGARYFGPFPSAWSARVTMKLLTETFQLRDCSDNVFAHRSRPCILYQMGKCSAPCVEFTTQPQYSDQIQQVIDTLDGKSDAVITSLKKGMDDAAEEMDFEKAAELRDQWMSLQVVTKPQVVDANDIQINRDVIGVAREGTQCQAVILQVRNGKLLALKPYTIQNTDPDQPMKEVLSQILEQHYVELDQIKQDDDIPRVASNTWPEAVLVSEIPSEYEWLERTLSIRVLTPETEAEKSLLQVAETNAAHGLKSSQRSEGSHGMSALEDVQSKLGLAKPPRRIECYDISNTQGTDSVASRVVFIATRSRRSKGPTTLRRCVKSSVGDFCAPMRTCRISSWSMAGRGSFSRRS
jgi:excinuclease ABC subunit C